MQYSFSFPVPVVGPIAKDFNFNPCSAPNLQEEFSSCGFYPITNGFTDAPSIKPDHAAWNVTRTVLIQIEIVFEYRRWNEIVIQPAKKYTSQFGSKQFESRFMRRDRDRVQMRSIKDAIVYGLRKANYKDRCSEWSTTSDRGFIAGFRYFQGTVVFYRAKN